MRNVLKSHDEVAHYWANKVQDSGRAGNMFFENGKIYSWGTHFCIARHLDNGRIAFTTREYSVSTSKHKSIVRGALGWRQNLIYIPYPEDGVFRNRECMASEIEDELRRATAPRIRANTRLTHYRHAQTLARNFNEYAMAEGSEARLPVSEIPDEAALVAKARDDEAKVEERREARREGRKADLEHASERLQEKLAKWRAGEYVQFNSRNVPTILRVKDDHVQTSRGAEIPLDHAKRLWPTILEVRQGGKDVEFERPLGVYSLERINADGSIKVGCHDIGWDEIAYIATVLGLTEEQAA